MDEEQQAQQALKEMFRHDRAEVAAHPRRKPLLRDASRVRAWVIGIAVFLLVIVPVAFFVVYPRFGPVDTMTSFCLAEGNGEYAQAYALLSQPAQQRESLTDFTRASQAASLEDCSVNGGVPFIFGETRATLNVTYTFYQGIASSSDGTMSFVRENGQWRVDSTSAIF